MPRSAKDNWGLIHSTWLSLLVLPFRDSSFLVLFKPAIGILFSCQRTSYLLPKSSNTLNILLLLLPLISFSIEKHVSLTASSSLPDKDTQSNALSSPLSHFSPQSHSSFFLDATSLIQQHLSPAAVTHSHIYRSQAQHSLFASLQEEP